VSQLFFDFYQTHIIDNFKEEDFLHFAENKNATILLDNFFKDFLKNKFFKNIIIYGDSCVGKTHLLNIYANKFRLEIISLSKLDDLQPLDYFHQKQIYILDDLSLFQDENKILQIINCANEVNAGLILIYRKFENYQTPDLNSRIQNMLSVNIENYSPAHLKIIFANILTRKQIYLNQKLLDLIFKKKISTPADIAFMAKKIEEISNISGKKITAELLNLK